MQREDTVREPVQGDEDDEHVDVLIVGAGLTGIGAAWRLQASLPHKRYAILEARNAMGGTWDLFRYPGIRSDSDMQTFGYSFRPWREPQAIADGASILDYIRQTASEAGIDQHIRFGQRVISASWSSADARWTLEVRHSGTAGPTTTITCSFLYMCTGYYRYDQGYNPSFEGQDQFAGQIVHPQQWPADLDYRGKRVIVIGSGATAITLVPTMARTAAHVTMLQRSPTYILSLPARDPVATGLRRLIGERAAYPVVRWKNILINAASYQLGQRVPSVSRAVIRGQLKRLLPKDYDVNTHFNPRYKPWDQRLCVVPDGDLFEAISDGRASVVTDHVDAFTKTGVRVASGQEIPADIVVTATGLDLLGLGGVRLVVDGAEVTLSGTTAYRGVMLSGVPNLVFTMGYTNASWTLKADLVSDFVCRLLAHMDRKGHGQVVPTEPPGSAHRPLLDFSAGYVQRSIDRFPRSGAKDPWRPGNNYLRDLVTFRRAPLDDDALHYTPRPSAALHTSRTSS
ncbi:flavin-containing monooxygenase [Streptomyces galbus]|uniref:NAD(P)/FAD-dependent oxidoreductase n=1 Tax=Streptomyces galbus TaxID=33898 RepID=A0A4U5X119_STRGB|nr:NAD(P)/FAD-dependent oxidoreductase [Streptomyces galbus]TKT08032.1 NAD(P)/FAD-dependent oxidoreductase [Streptomyces galbus]GHD42333.1 flavin-binding monooxygenase [Streptomyces galbus]